MKYGIPLLVLGIAIGCGGTLVVDRLYFDSTDYLANSDRWSKALETSGSGVAGARLPELLSGTGSVAEQSAIALIAARTDAAGVRARIIEVVDSPPSAQRQFALNLLIARYAELDPGAAVNLVHELDLDDAMLARVFGIWAELDGEQAIAALRREIDADRAVAIAVAIVAALDGDERAVSRVAAALPPGVDSDRFHIEIIGRIAAAEPERAMRQALTLSDSPARSQALRRVAKAWVATDPVGAIGQAHVIEDTTERQQFLMHVARDWARADPDTLIRFLRANGDDRDIRTLARYASSTLAVSHPRELLAIADSLKPQLAFSMRYAALQSLARTDPQGAIDLLQDMPTGGRRRHILQSIAQGYAEADMDAALAWARSLPAHERDKTIPAMLGVIARTDPGRAIDHALSLEDQVHRMQAVHHIVMRSLHESGNGQEIGRRLLAIEQDDARQESLDAFTSMWAQTDPEAALEWMLANDAATSSRRFSRVAQELAAHDPNAAIRMAKRVPADARDAWITQVAGSYAKGDPQGAMNWLQQFQGQPHYEAALAAVAQHSAEYDPKGVAALVPSIGDPGRASTVAAAAAGSWSRREPRAAAHWALQLADEDVRSAAVAGVANRWADSDPAAAERWVLSLTSGATRDNALRAVVSEAARDARSLERLFDAFSTDSGREQAAQLAVYAIARRDMQEARAFLDEYVSDPATRQRLERQIARYATRF